MSRGVKNKEIKKQKGKKKKEMTTDHGLRDDNNPLFKLKIDLYQ